MQTVGGALDDGELVVEAFDEAEGDLVLWSAVGGNAVPMTIDHLGQLFEVLETLPLEARPPVVEEISRLDLAREFPQLTEGLLEQVGGVEPLVGGEQPLEV